MAQRPAWTIKKDTVVCEDFEFEWNGGFAVVQKKKNIHALHDAIKATTGQTVLEVSTKSDDSLGYSLSAFVLELDGFFVECIYQSSKIYQNGGPYLDLLNAEPKDAKRDERHRTSGGITRYEYDGCNWPLEPKSAFYDYIYIKAVIENFGKTLDLSSYQWFTDIEFNPKKSISSQARAITTYKLIQQLNCFDVLDDKDIWIDFYQKHVQG